MSPWPGPIRFGHQATVSSADGPGSRLRGGSRSQLVTCASTNDRVTCERWPFYFERCSHAQCHAQHHRSPTTHSALTAAARSVESARRRRGFVAATKTCDHTDVQRRQAGLHHLASGLHGVYRPGASHRRIQVAAAKAVPARRRAESHRWTRSLGSRVRRSQGAARPQVRRRTTTSGNALGGHPAVCTSASWQPRRLGQIRRFNRCNRCQPEGRRSDRRTGELDVLPVAAKEASGDLADPVPAVGLRAGQGRLSGESADMGLPGVRISSHRNRDNSRTRCQAPRCNSNTAAGASPSTSTNTLCREADVCGTTAVRSVQRTARGVGLSHTPATRQRWTVGARQAGGSVLPVPWERPHRDGLQEHSTVRHQRLHEDAPPSSASTASQAIRIEQQPTSNSKHRERSGTRHGRGCACSHHDRPLTDVNASGPSNGASDTPQWTTFGHRQRSSRRRQHPVVPQLGRRSRTRHRGRVEATHGGHAKRADQNISDNASPRPAGKLRLNVSLRASRDNR